MLRLAKKTIFVRGFVNRNSELSTTNEFDNLFSSEGERFRWLSHILTGNLEEAQAAFDDAFDQSHKSSHRVFRNWMASWVRRLIIKSSIGIMQSQIKDAANALSGSSLSHHKYRSVKLLDLQPEMLERHLPQLDELSRFVLVLRSVERYSRRETSLLLGISEAVCDRAYYQGAERLQMSAMKTTDDYSRKPVDIRAMEFGIHEM